MLVNAAPPMNRPARVRAAARGRGNLCASRRSCLRRPPFPRADAPSRSSRRSPSPRVARVRARPRFWHQFGARARRSLRRRRGIRQLRGRLSQRRRGDIARSQRPSPRPAISRRLPRRARAKRQRRARRRQEHARLRRLESGRRRRRHDGIEPAAGRCAEPPARARGEVEGRSFGAVLAVEGPHELARGRKDHRAGGQTPPGAGRQMRRRLFLRMVLVENLALPERLAGDVRSRLFVGRNRRLAARHARRRHRPAADQARRLPGRPQGALFGRMGRPAGQGVPGDARSAARRAARPPLRKGLRRPRAGRLAVRRMGRQSSGSPSGFPSRSASSTCITARSAAACARGLWSR